MWTLLRSGVDWTRDVVYGAGRWSVESVVQTRRNTTTKNGPLLRPRIHYYTAVNSQEQTERYLYRAALAGMLIGGREEA